MNFFKWLSLDFAHRRAALSLYKRGLARAKQHDRQGAMDNFNAAIDMADAPADVRAMALYNRALLFAAVNDIPKAVHDLHAVLTMEEPLHDIKQAARRRLDHMQHRTSPATDLHRSPQKSS